MQRILRPMALSRTAEVKVWASTLASKNIWKKQKFIVEKFGFPSSKSTDLGRKLIQFCSQISEFCAWETKFLKMHNFARLVSKLTFALLSLSCRVTCSTVRVPTPSTGRGSKPTESHQRGGYVGRDKMCGFCTCSAPWPRGGPTNSRSAKTNQPARQISERTYPKHPRTLANSF